MATTTTLRFTLSVGSLPADSFRVQTFSLSEEISECWRLEITASTPEMEINYDEVIGKPAQLEVAGDDFNIARNGIVTRFDQFPDDSQDFGRESYSCILHIAPKFQLLAYTSQSRIFQNLDLPAIVKKVLDGHGLSGSDYAWDAAGTFASQEFTVQYNESDLNFVQRLLEDAGVYYCFRNQDKKEKLVFADKGSTVMAQPDHPKLNLMHTTGLSHLSEDHVLHIRKSKRMVTGKTRIKDYNDRTPDSIITGNAEKPGQGEAYDFSPHVGDASAAGQMALRRAEMLSSEKVLVEGEGVCRPMRPGHRFELVERGGGSFSGNYFVLATVHHGDQREGFEGDTQKQIFTTHFRAIPMGQAYRPPFRTPKPSIAGVLLAKIDGPSGQYATLDEEGRYHAKMPYDLSDLKDGNASLPIRLAQPYGGPAYGMHFPNHNGNDLLVAFIGGDVNRPVAVGVAPNPSNASPVTSQNKSESVIKTASGHILRMDDLEKKTVIEITTAGEHTFEMNDDDDAKHALLTTEGRHTLILDDTGKKIQLTTTYGHQILMDDGGKLIRISTPDGHFILMDDPGKSITVQDGAGKTKIHMDGGAGNIEMTASANITLSAGESVTINAGKTIDVSSGKDTSFNSGKTFTVTAADNLDLTTQKSSSIQVAKNLNIEAGDKIRGATKKASIEGSDSVQIQGKKILNKSDNDFQVDAGKVNIKASGDVILKGSKIKQN